MRLLYTPLVLIAFMASAQSANPQSTDSFLRDYAETRRFLSGRPVRPQITKDGSTVLFLRAQARSPVQTLFSFDVATGKTTEILTPQSLLKGAEQTMSAAEKARLERQRISARGFTHYQLSPDGTRIAVTLSGTPYLVERSSLKVTALPTGAGVTDPQFSPDGRLLAYVKDNDVHVMDLTSLKQARVTKGGTELAPNGLAEFVAQEEMGRFSGFWWSPDSASIIHARADHEGMERFAIQDPMHPERGVDQFPYPRPGKANAKVSLFIVKLGGAKPVEVKWDTARYPYLATVVWPKKGALSVLVQNRNQTEQVLYAVDATSGKLTELLKEKDAAWINLDQSFPHWKQDGSGFLWFTERNGGNEVEERDAKGALKGSWVTREAGFANFVALDEANGYLYFTGSPDPTVQVLWRVKWGEKPERVPLRATKPSTMIDVEATRSFQTARVSDDGKVLVVETHAPHFMPRSAVYKEDGTKIADLPSVAEEPKLKPNIRFEQVAGRRFNAAIITPANFKEGQKYPVVVEVYGGPGHSVVRRTMRDNLLLQWLADQGFIVVKFDGRGTPGRGRDWERAIKHDFATVTLADQVEALQALGKQMPEMDMARVGIEGWSFGGYMSALAVEARGDVYKAAVAGAPVVDWLDYDTHYTERYLGTPQEHPKAYEVSSLLTYAPKLNRPLLLIHGTADDNVYFFHTLKLSDALFRAGRRHEVLPLSNFTHMVPDPLVQERLWQRIAEHFKANL